MARIRSLKPGFFSNEDLAELPFECRLCFAGLWTLADREGRLEDRPRRIKAALFPYDAVDVNAMLTALEGKNFVVRYAADGVAYLAIPTFTQHQRPKTDETASVIPAHSLGDPRGIVTAPRSYNGVLGLGSGQVTGDSGADVAPRAADGAVESSEAADGAGARPGAEAFAALWNEITKAPIPKCRELSSNRRRQIKARLSERDWDQWRQVIMRIQESVFCRGESGRGDWVASFDWVIGSSDVAVKVLEGKYDDRRSIAAAVPMLSKQTTRMAAVLANIKAAEA